MFGLDGLISGAMSLFGANSANDRQDARQEDAQMFNSAEAQKNRDFQSAEQGRVRDFNETMMHMANNNADVVRRETQAYNAAEAQKARDFTERQSSTAYQRAVEDMKAAGINPMLAYMKGGADTGASPAASSAGSSSASASTGGVSGSSASSPTPATVQNAIATAMSSAREWSYVKPQVDNIKQDTAVKAADERVKYDTAHNLMLQGRQIDQLTKNSQVDEKIKKEQLKQVERQATVADIDQDYYGTKIGKIFRNIGNAGKDLNPFVSSAKGLNQMVNGD